VIATCFVQCWSSSSPWPHVLPWHSKLWTKNTLLSSSTLRQSTGGTIGSSFDRSRETAWWVDERGGPCRADPAEPGRRLG
jgi:hypothetical protein